MAIINRLRAGEKNITIANDYGVGHSTISQILKNKENILEANKRLTNECDKRARCRVFEISVLEFDRIMFSWFTQQRDIAASISGSILKEQARIMKEKLGEAGKFKASNGWLHKFKKRYSIRDKGGFNKKDSEQFSNDLLEYISAEGFNLDNVYNADETGLLWTALPWKTSVADNKEENTDPINTEDRITIMNCTNALGTHNLPLLVIGKQTPHRLTNIEMLPIEYTTQRNAWMDTSIFNEWYRDIFLPSVMSRNPDENAKFLLILHNAPSHPSAEELNKIEARSTIRYLPKFLPTSQLSFSRWIKVLLEQ